MPEFWSALGNTIWWGLTFIIFISYLSVLFSIVADLFRDRELSGGMKALWIFCLIFFPFITALVYIIVRGKGMNDRAIAQANEAKAATDTYIRSVAGSPADEIARAKALLDAGTINADEYAALKAKALA
ncbi:MAG: PLDc N-terminal domain-containing protein [Actinobacteria bacterium]|nr:PLDc N-terminal domain-containing protein [Actinomycetota bacterium]